MSNASYKMVVRNDQETGELGLMFSDCPVIAYPMVANEGLLVAHDLLEHVNGLNKIGSIDDELEALGGVYFVRGEYGVLSRDRVGSAYSVEENIASDVVNMARIYNNGVNFKTGVPKFDKDSFMYEIAIEVLEHAKNSVYDEIEEDELNQERLDYYLQSCVAYMVAGYEKANAKYKQFEVNQLFWNIAEEVDQFLKDNELIEGMELILYVDFEDLTCSIGNDEDITQIDIEHEGDHHSFTIFDGDFYELECWLDENELESINSDTYSTLNEIESAVNDQKNYIVLPVNDTEDMTVDFTYNVTL